MTRRRLDEFLEASPLFESTRDEIRNAERWGKGEMYQEAIFWHRLDAVQRYCGELHSYVARSAIFFPSSLRDKFVRVSDQLWDAVTSKAVGHEHRNFEMQQEAWTKREADITPLYKAIESEIHARLRSHGPLARGNQDK